ncbi:universal stress protein [Kitasatospora sp. NPDC091335]|uniref:universal stress protein n=1 Tax=Kitasatospora sp. NPDC091335 TaxID=3364085 RepID=UPI0037F4F50B
MPLRSASSNSEGWRWTVPCMGSSVRPCSNICSNRKHGLRVWRWTASGLPSSSRPPEYGYLAEARMERALDEAFGGLPIGVPVRPLVLRGEAAKVLPGLADRPGDLLVVGTGEQGGLRSALRRLLRRSVTRHCLHRARCGVLAVPPSTLHQDLWALHRGIDLRELAAA